MNIVVLSGAGMSVESGLSTFRGSNGLWDKYKIEEVASIEGWHRNPKLVLEFYNKRREQLKTVKPNEGHFLLAQAEKNHDICIVTQNVDDLHERAGSTNIIHLHGELTKVKSTKNPYYIKDIGYAELNWGDTCANGHQLRPNVVWFGEEVPMLSHGAEKVSQCDVLLIIGTSLNVYPAASLVHYAPSNAQTFIIDPNEITISTNDIVHIKQTASSGIKKALELVGAKTKLL